MGKNIKTFEDFINEEISDEYLKKQLNKARTEDGRQITPGYEASLRDKQSNLKKNDADRQRLAYREKMEKLYQELTVITNTLNDRFKEQKWNIYDMNLSVSVSVRDAKNLDFMFIKEGSQKQAIFKFVYATDVDILYPYKYDTNGIKETSFQDANSFFPELIKIFREFFPQSKYADRKIWSGLE